MISFFKSKPILQDLIPDNFIDIHSHILPGIDDGAKTIEDSLFLIKSLQGFGASQIITTPHVIHNFYNNNSQNISEKATETIIDLKKNNVGIPFKAAAEYMIDSQFEKLVATKDLLTLKDNYVLIEMSYMNPPIQLYTILFDLQVAGYIPVLAHPERYGFFHNNFDQYRKLLDAGCLLQINLLSIVGYYGEGIFKVAEKLLKNGYYSFAGSDAHHEKHIAAFGQKILLKDQQPLIEVLKNNEFFRID